MNERQIFSGGVGPGVRDDVLPSAVNELNVDLERGDRCQQHTGEKELQPAMQHKLAANFDEVDARSEHGHNEHQRANDDVEHECRVVAEKSISHGSLRKQSFPRTPDADRKTGRVNAARR
jgi:hypothetical protein